MRSASVLTLNRLRGRIVVNLYLAWMERFSVALAGVW